MGEAKRRKMLGKGPKMRKTPLNIMDFRIKATVDYGSMWQTKTNAVMRRLDGKDFELTEYADGGVAFNTPGGVNITPIRDLAYGLVSSNLESNNKQQANALMLSIINGSDVCGPNPVSNIFVYIIDDDFGWVVVASHKPFSELPRNGQVEMLQGIVDELNRQ